MHIIYCRTCYSSAFVRYVNSLVIYKINYQYFKNVKLKQGDGKMSNDYFNGGSYNGGFSHIDSYGNIRNNMNNLNGYVDSYRNIRDSNKNVKGYVDSYGNVRDSSNNIKGYVDSYGNFRK